MKLKLKILASYLEVSLLTLISLVLVVFFSRKSLFSKKVKQERPIMILGNGPSLRDDIDAVIELREGGRVDICSVNDFAFSEAFFKVRPSLYVLADPNYWSDNVSKDVEIRRVRLIEIFANDVVWPMRVMVPVEAKGSSVFDRACSEFVIVEYYNRTPISGFDWVRFRLFDVGAGMPPAYNVLIAALAISIAGGYKKIFVLGADHSWHEELNLKKEGVLVAQKHFYDERVELKPVYKAVGEVFTIGELFIRWGKVFRTYEVLALYAQYKRAVVYNLSSKTYVDAFSRAKSSELEDL